MVQEEKVSEAFSRQSGGFDKSDNENEILKWMRSRVRDCAIHLWKPGDSILELNAGTGLDALFFAEKGFRVHATDNAPGMLNAIKDKIDKYGVQDKITTQRCSFLELNKLIPQRFDHIFSNFGGLNCTDKLDSVIQSLEPLLKPGGTVTLVIMPPICPWELLYFLKGNFKLAFRRLNKKGTSSHLEGLNFTTWYYSPAEVKSMLGKNYSTLSITGLGIVVPPPFLEHFPLKYPNIFRRLASIEKSISAKAPFYSWADHFIITAKKLH